MIGVDLRRMRFVSFFRYCLPYLNWINKCSQANDGCFATGNCKISFPPFADDLILLPQNLVSSAY